MYSNRTLLRFGAILAVGASIVASCSMMKGSSSGGGSTDMPSWFLDNRPMDPHHIFAAATATAPRLQLASSKAASQARGDIAATIETRFQGLTKQFREEVGQGPGAKEAAQFTQAYQSVISRTINGSEVVKREIQREGDGYRAYVLMRMPIGQAQEKLMAQLEAQGQAFSRFRESEAYTQLEQDVEGYRQREKDRQARKEGRRPVTRNTMGQAREETADAGETRQMGEQATDEQVQAQTGEVSEQQAEAGAGRRMGEQAGEKAVQAPEESESQASGAPVSPAEAAEAKLRSVAESWMGTPYELGGESRDGVDCSALVQALYDEAFNMDLPRTTGKQAGVGRSVSRSNMRPGDLVFFRTADQQKHVGAYLDNGTFVHASSSSGVTVSPLRYDYWQSNYWTTRRLGVI
jgi:cell wall-associated NlpC family hydrolase